MPLNGFKSLLPEKFRGAHRGKVRKFIYVDGTPYGTEGFMRYARSPLLQASMLTCIFASAARVLLAPADAKLSGLLTNLAMDAPITLGVASILVKAATNWDKLYTIDKSGYGGGNPEATRYMASQYAGSAGNSLLPLFGCALTISAMVYGKGALDKAGIIGIVARSTDWLVFGVKEAHLSLMSVLTPTFAMSVYAHSKLTRGKWNVATPPRRPSKKEAKETIPAKTQLASHRMIENTALRPG